MVRRTELPFDDVVTCEIAVQNARSKLAGFYRGIQRGIVSIWATVLIRRFATLGVTIRCSKITCESERQGELSSSNNLQ